MRAGAFACELAARRRWLDPGHAHWIAENLSALRGFAVEVVGAGPGDETAALVIESCPIAALAVLSAVPHASMGPSLAALGEPWWPRGAGGPVLLTGSDAEVLDRLLQRRARVVPVAVQLTGSPAGSRWSLRGGVTRARLRFGAPLEPAAG
ncbi:MAG TPA: hypothetical protein VNO33_08820 [Kofleriaceae bacterium]|nr:hypothetical protein [Kofleriaceae bacterium]